MFLGNLTNPDLKVGAIPSFRTAGIPSLQTAGNSFVTDCQGQFLRFGRSGQFPSFGRSGQFLHFGRSEQFLRYSRSGAVPSFRKVGTIPFIRTVGAIPSFRTVGAIPSLQTVRGSSFVSDSRGNVHCFKLTEKCPLLHNVGGMPAPGNPIHFLLLAVLAVPPFLPPSLSRTALLKPATTRSKE